MLVAKKSTMVPKLGLIVYVTATAEPAGGMKTVVDQATCLEAVMMAAMKLRTLLTCWLACTSAAMARPTRTRQLAAAGTSSAACQWRRPVRLQASRRRA